MADEERGTRQFYACVFYDTQTDKFFIENWESGTGRDDGDIFDDELSEWRYPNNDIVAGEEELDDKVWTTMRKAIEAIPPLNPVGSTEEEDVVY